MSLSCHIGDVTLALAATSIEAATDESRALLLRGEYDTRRGTTWDTFRVLDEDGDIVAVEKVAIDPPVPPCTGAAHDWKSPHWLVGGLADNPGVHGHGGGVTITSACLHCGCGRVENTWAQDPEDGEQGLRSVRYEPRAYIEPIEDRRRAFCYHGGEEARAGDRVHDLDEQDEGTVIEIDADDPRNPVLLDLGDGKRRWLPASVLVLVERGDQ